MDDLPVVIFEGHDGGGEDLPVSLPSWTEQTCPPRHSEGLDSVYVLLQGERCRTIQALNGTIRYGETGVYSPSAFARCNGKECLLLDLVLSTGGARAVVLLDGAAAYVPIEDVIVEHVSFPAPSASRFTGFREGVWVSVGGGGFSQTMTGVGMAGNVVLGKITKISGSGFIEMEAHASRRGDVMVQISPPVSVTVSFAVVSQMIFPHMSKIDPNGDWRSVVMNKDSDVQILLPLHSYGDGSPGAHSDSHMVSKYMNDKDFKADVLAASMGESGASKSQTGKKFIGSRVVMQDGGHFKKDEVPTGVRDTTLTGPALDAAAEAAFVASAERQKRELRAKGWWSTASQGEAAAIAAVRRATEARRTAVNKSAQAVKAAAWEKQSEEAGDVDHAIWYRKTVIEDGAISKAAAVKAEDAARAARKAAVDTAAAAEILKGTTFTGYAQEAMAYAKFAEEEAEKAEALAKEATTAAAEAEAAAAPREHHVRTSGRIHATSDDAAGAAGAAAAAAAGIPEDTPQNDDDADDDDDDTDDNGSSIASDVPATTSGSDTDSTRSEVDTSDAVQASESESESGTSAGSSAQENDDSSDDDDDIPDSPIAATHYPPANPIFAKRYAYIYSGDDSTAMLLDELSRPPRSAFDINLFEELLMGRGVPQHSIAMWKRTSTAINKKQADRLAIREGSTNPSESEIRYITTEIYELRKELASHVSAFERYM